MIVEGAGLDEQELSRRLRAEGYHPRAWAVTDLKRPTPRRRLRCEVRWRCHPREVQSPGWLRELLDDPNVSKVAWEP